MEKVRGAKQLMVCKKNGRGVEVKRDWDKRELVTALQGISPQICTVTNFSEDFLIIPLWCLSTL